MSLSIRMDYVPVIIGSSGRLSKALLDQYINLNQRVIGCTREITTIWNPDSTSSDFSSLTDALNSICCNNIPILLIFGFRSRNLASLDQSYLSISSAVDSVCSYSNVKPSLVFLNSICSVRNEATQKIYYHLEKSLMSRLSLWYSSDPRVNSSLDIIMHVVPGDSQKLSTYCCGLVSLIEANKDYALSGSQLFYNCTSHIQAS